MAFENLSQKLNDIFKNLRGKGKLSEKDVKDALREVKLALLEADVNFKVVKEFVNKITERAIGVEVMGSLTPGQQVVKIVNDELIELLGTTQSKLTFSSKPPTVYMLVGLQGAGKTTTAGKLSGLLRKQGKKPLLVACDIYRPAAIKQLEIVAKTYTIPVFSMGDKVSPIEIAKESLAFAEKNDNDVVIIDTAGRLHLNEELMDELDNIKKAVRPQEILLVIDSMTGQEAVTVSEAFNKRLEVDGIILTKLDSDTRGGAAISVRSATGKPIKFAAMGEKMTDLEPFHPERMASRILGMGDILSLVEKAQMAIDEEKAQELEKKMRNNEFSLDDFLEQMQQIKKMGSLQQIIGMIPGLSQVNPDELQVDEKNVAHIEAVIKSMTKEERRNPSVLNGSRKKRIAAGSGTTIQEVNKLVKQFEEMRKMMKQMTEMTKGKKGKFKMPFMK